MWDFHLLTFPLLLGRGDGVASAFGGNKLLFDKTEKILVKINQAIAIHDVIIRNQMFLLKNQVKINTHDSGKDKAVI